MEQERMEAFANRIWKWNRKLRMIDWLFVAVYYAVLLAFVAGLVIAKKKGLELSRYIIIFNAADALFMQLLYGFLYGHVFIAAEGREGKTIQELMFTLKNMPFSPEEYYAFIWKGFRKRIGWNAVISFAVLSNAFYISGNVKMLWLSLLYVAVASAVAAAGFFLHRYSVLKYFNREGNKRKKIFKKKAKERKHMNKLKKCAIVMAGLIVLIIDYMLASKEYANLLETYGNEFGWIGTVACIGPYCLVGIVAVIVAFVLVRKSNSL